MKAECTKHLNDKQIVFQENKSKLTILNPDQATVTRVEVDGCEITEGMRCDFFMEAKAIEYFIELKGQNLEKAMKQLKTTISQLSKNVKKQKKVSFIICTRSPMSSASIQNHQAKFRKQFSSRLIIKSSPFKHKI